ncbi:MAG: ornithine carbamoyltransferase [Myxococcota bacterium]
MVTQQRLSGRDFITLQDFSVAELDVLVDTARRLKHERQIGQRHLDILAGQTLFMVFYNPSLRTRNSFEAGIHQLGGHAHFLQPSQVRMPVLAGEEQPYATERISDVARVLSSMGESIAVRALGQSVGWEYRKGLSIIEEFARWSTVPVINMEDNIHHPCQGLADLMTLRELLGPDLRGRKIAVAWVYSPSTTKPIAPHHDFLYVASLGGANLVFAHPPALRIDPDIEDVIRNNSRISGGSYTVVDDLAAACDQADVIYAKNYVCLDLMPPATTEPMHEQMRALFEQYQHWIIDEHHMKMAKDDARYMHCLPCDRGFEVTDRVLDGPWGHSVFRAAENRLHAQKAMMSCILSPTPSPNPSPTPSPTGQPPR